MTREANAIILAENPSLITALFKFTTTLLLPLLISAFLVLLLTPASASAASPARQDSANAHELMENLRDALRGGQFLDEAFYTEDEMKKLTGAEHVRILRNGNDPVRHVAVGVSPGTSAFRIELEIAADGDRRVLIDGYLPHGQSPLRAPAVEKLFGQAWKNDALSASADGGKRQYRFRDKGIVEKGHFSFNQTGSLDNFVLIRKKSARPIAETAQTEFSFDNFLPRYIAR